MSSGKAEKGEHGLFWPISRKGGQTPLKPPFVAPPSAAAQLKQIQKKFINCGLRGGTEGGKPGLGVQRFLGPLRGPEFDPSLQ